MLSAETMIVFQHRLMQLAREFNELNKQDAVLPLEKRQGSTVVLATRNWQYGLFDSLRKKA